MSKIYSEKTGIFSGWIFTFVKEVEFQAQVVDGVINLNTVRVNTLFAGALRKVGNQEEYLAKAKMKFEKKDKFQTLGGNPVLRQKS